MIDARSDSNLFQQGVASQTVRIVRQDATTPLEQI